MQRYFYRYLSLLLCLTLVIMVQPDTSSREDETIVSVNGLLKVKGNRIVNQNDTPISLAGNSLFWKPSKENVLHGKTVRGHLFGKPSKEKLFALTTFPEAFCLGNQVKKISFA